MVLRPGCEHPAAGCQKNYCTKHVMLYMLRFVSRELLCRVWYTLKPCSKRCCCCWLTLEAWQERQQLQLLADIGRSAGNDHGERFHESGPRTNAESGCTPTGDSFTQNLLVIIVRTSVQ